MQLLDEAFFLEAQELSSHDGYEWRPKRLTYEGHEFLDTCATARFAADQGGRGEGRSRQCAGALRDRNGCSQTEAGRTGILL